MANRNTRRSHKPRQGPRHGGTTSLPPHLQRLIEQAGASAYQWHDQSLAEYVDRTGVLHRVARWVNYLTVGALTLSLVTLLLLRVEPLPILAAVLVGGGWGVRRFRTPSWIVSAVALVAAVRLTGSTSLAMTLVVLAAIATWAIINPRHRDQTFLVTAAALAAVTAVAGTMSAYPVLLVVTALLTLGLSVWFSGVRSLPRPFARVSEEDLTRRPPSPPTSLPWLVQVFRARQIEEEPEEIRRKKIGADGERRTAVMLLALDKGKGTRIAHDVAIPGADSANADHVVLARSGLFIIDSKQFGSRDDPGLVTYDQGSREIVHRTNRGSRSIEKSLRTAAWAVEALSNVVGVPGAAILAIHNAAVAKNLRVVRNGIEIEVIPSWELGRRIDQSAPRFSWSQMASARMGMFRMKSSTTGGSPFITSPRGLQRQAQGYVQDRAMSASGPDVSTVARRGDTRPMAQRPKGSSAPRSSGASASPPSSEGRATARPRSNTPAASPKQVTRPGPAASATSQPAPPTQPLPVKKATAPPKGVERAEEAIAPEPVLSAQERVSDRWAQMAHSERAAPDDVEPELRGLERGTAILVIEFTTEDVRSQEMVAMTGVCAGVDGNYIWYCQPEQYQIHKRSGKEVNVSTVSTSKVMVKPTGGVA